ncbi:hypothetical protein [Teichococcus cervicalis]|uniref:Uncharacterized protein n=1 Tax=Pseudoroseomonas cervicalis ATCC 49957 TaxID=525371 RepID=D5RIK8_9PROT|nr:hypothetical protein [Pseudoroseomonas cervicalis]EFH12862.1 hypothetical protein HMPREF0731_0918 [Pseudoroseomonas cervicalis ATCC 49957]
MTDTLPPDRDTPDAQDRAPSPARPALSERDARRAAALRENLRRRKAQSRGRAETPSPAETAPPPPALQD